MRKNQETNGRHIVDLTWDNEASVWIAISQDICGLTLECSSLNKLIMKVELSIRELQNLNKLSTEASIYYRFAKLQ